jgi:SAM-dependent methyltransferase
LTASHRKSLEALPPGGTILDVGVGGGAASLPLAAEVSKITGVDSSPKMLESFRRAAARVEVEVEAIEGEWPQVSPQVGGSDVAVCHHVLYNVPDLAPFIDALSSKARRRVVVELTPNHPLAWMSDLWLTLHGLVRPVLPTYRDAAEVIAELGFKVQTSITTAPPVTGGFADRGDAIAFVRKRMCLRPEDDERLAEALGDRLSQKDGGWSAAPPQHEIATLWWDL